MIIFRIICKALTRILDSQREGIINIAQTVETWMKVELQFSSLSTSVIVMDFSGREKEEKSFIRFTMGINKRAPIMQKLHNFVFSNFQPLYMKGVKLSITNCSIWNESHDFKQSCQRITFNRYT